LRPRHRPLRGRRRGYIYVFDCGDQQLKRSIGVRKALGRWAKMTTVITSCVPLANCASSDLFASKVDPKYGVSASARVVEPGDPVPKGGGVYRVGKPYVVAGQTYVPQENRRYSAEGLASWYGNDFHGRLTANGEVFDMDGISAAHPTLPMPCYARVTNLANRRSIVVRVNDRGPYEANRVIDVSVRAAKLLGFHGNGVARVRVEYVGPAPLDGSDDHLLAATLREGEPAPAPSPIMVASAKSFLPPVGETPAARIAVPIPADRPLTLGEPQSVEAARSRQRTTYVPSLSPVTAYAPTPEDAMLSAGVPAPVFNGRGLY
jgi:rare lipoprotein A